MTNQFLKRMGGAFAIMVLFFTTSKAQISTANSSEYIGDGQWRWTVYINAPPDVLRNISSVKYTLHSTFSPRERPVTKIGDANRPFALTATGWGTFEIKIKVVFRNGSSQNLTHQLVFGAKTARALAFSAGQKVTKLRTDWYKWTLFIKGSENNLQQVRCVEYTLHETFSKPVQEVCQRGTGLAFPLLFNGWGTFRVKIKVYLKDGSIQELSHDLDFVTNR